MWDAESGAELLTLAGHSDWVVSAEFSPDTPAGTGGSRVVTASEDGTARVWLVGIDELLRLAQTRIQRDPPLFTPEERLRFGLEGPNRANAP